MGCGHFMIPEVGSVSDTVSAQFMAGFVSHTHLSRHLFELSGEVPDGGHSLVKCREKLLPKGNKHEFFRSSCWKGLSNSVWTFSESAPRNPKGKPSRKVKRRLTGQGSSYSP